MHMATLRGFQDELEKIAKMFQGSAEEWDKLQHGSIENKINRTVNTADQFHADRVAAGKVVPTEMHTPINTQGTRTVTSPLPSKANNTTVARPPKGQTSVIKPPTAAPHVPTSVRAPTGGGFRAGAMKAMGAMRQHAAPIAIGSAVGLGLGAGAMAMRKRQANAAPR